MKSVIESFEKELEVLGLVIDLDKSIIGEYTNPRTIELYDAFCAWYNATGGSMDTGFTPERIVFGLKATGLGLMQQMDADTKREFLVLAIGNEGLECIGLSNATMVTLDYPAYGGRSTVSDVLNYHLDSMHDDVNNTGTPKTITRLWKGLLNRLAKRTKVKGEDKWKRNLN